MNPKNRRRRGDHLVTMIIVGERLNSSRRIIRQAFLERNEHLLVEEAKLQQRAGARYLDLNASALPDKEVETLRWAISLLQRRLKTSFSIDTPSAPAMEGALRIHRGRALLNSLSGERRKMRSLLPLIRDFKPKVIILCLDDHGIPDSAHEAVAIAQGVAEQLVRQGIGFKDIFVDPLLRPLSVDPRFGTLFLESLELIKIRLPGIQTIAGLSNVSFGLPRRRLLNKAMLVLAMEAGLDAVICDPLDEDLRASLVAATALLGRDRSLKNYLHFVREQGRKA